MSTEQSADQHTVTTTPTGELAFQCPRCSEPVTERFYGPCQTCRQQLRASGGGEARDIAEERFEPRMHVVANHVATKD